MRKPTSLQALHAFVLEHIDDAPLAKRTLLLRTLADVIGSASDAAQLREMADELDTIANKHGQLQLALRVGLKGGAP